MRTIRCGTLAFFGLACAACSDGPILTKPGPEIDSRAAGYAVAEDGYAAPEFTTRDEVPPEYEAVEILRAHSSANWEGVTARGYGFMEYIANRGEQTVTVSVVGESGTVGTTKATARHGSLFPETRLLGTPVSFTVRRDCGQTVNVVTEHYAATVAIIDLALFTIGEKQFNTGADAAQPDCDPEPCAREADREITLASYDPYGKETGCESDGTGGSGDGSGTQFNPGDYTGGETVDWSTGVGNGGTSTCGDLAQVEYICIDVWDDEQGKWVEWSCGYATTC